jgi:hypothetical protein
MLGSSHSFTERAKHLKSFASFAKITGDGSVFLSADGTTPTASTGSSASATLTLEVAEAPEAIVVKGVVNFEDATVPLGTHHASHCLTFLVSVDYLLSLWTLFVYLSHQNLLRSHLGLSLER